MIKPDLSDEVQVLNKGIKKMDTVDAFFDQMNNTSYISNDTKLAKAL